MFFFIFGKDIIKTAYNNDNDLRYSSAFESDAQMTVLSDAVAEHTTQKSVAVTMTMNLTKATSVLLL